MSVFNVNRNGIRIEYSNSSGSRKKPVVWLPIPTSIETILLEGQHKLADRQLLSILYNGDELKAQDIATLQDGAVLTFSRHPSNLRREDRTVEDQVEEVTNPTEPPPPQIQEGSDDYSTPQSLAYIATSAITSLPTNHGLQRVDTRHVTEQEVQSGDGNNGGRGNINDDFQMGDDEDFYSFDIRNDQVRGNRKEERREERREILEDTGGCVHESRHSQRGSLHRNRNQD